MDIILIHQKPHALGYCCTLFENIKLGFYIPTIPFQWEREKICDNQLKGAGQVIAKGGQENAFFRSENPKNSHMLDNNVSH